MDRGFWKLFPNLFVILVSASAVDRKTTAINIANDIVRSAALDLNFIAQKITTEALIKSMQDEFAEHGVGAGYAVAEELAVFLGKGSENSQLLQILTKAWGCPDILDYHTRGRGKESADKACLNLLGGSTPEWLHDCLPGQAIAGGFAGRVIFVHPKDGERKRIAFPRMTKDMILLRDSLIHDLSVARDLKGEYTLTGGAKKWFETWYEEIFDPTASEATLEGYYARKHDTVLKIGMVLSASRNGSMRVLEEDIERAIRILNETEKTLPYIMKKVDSTQVGDDMYKVLGVIKRKGKVSYSDLLRSVSYRLTASQVQDILTSLAAQDLIEEEVTKGKKRNVRSFVAKEGK